MTKTTEPDSSSTQKRSRSKHLVVSCGVALLPLVLTVGCSASDANGSSRHDSASASASETLDGAFVARVERVCEPYTKYNSTHYFNVQGFTRFDPSAALLPRVAAFLNRNPAYRTLVPDLEKLGQPDTGGAAWSEVMAGFSSNDKVMKQEILSARQRDVDAFKRYDARVTTATSGLHAHLVELGLPGASVCYGVQGDPLETVPVE